VDVEVAVAVLPPLLTWEQLVTAWTPNIGALMVVGLYADILFRVRAVQNIVLLMITPMFLALGAPLTLLRDGLPGPAPTAGQPVAAQCNGPHAHLPPGDHAVLIAPPHGPRRTPVRARGESSHWPR
jgi:caa3-type cytochrome oxidase assembly factor Caa3/CtaG